MFQLKDTMNSNRCVHIHHLETLMNLTMRYPNQEAALHYEIKSAQELINSEASFSTSFHRKEYNCTSLIVTFFLNLDLVAWIELFKVFLMNVISSNIWYTDDFNYREMIAHFVARIPDAYSLLEIILSRELNMTFAKNIQSRTSLHITIFNKSFKNAEMLVQYDANVNTFDIFDLTSLHMT